MRATLGFASLLLITSCSSPSGTPGTGPVDLPSSNAPTSTPNGKAILYFEGSVDVARGTMTLVTRSPSGDVQEQATLPYGLGANKVYFHTCPATTSYTHAGSGGSLSATVQAVNDMSAAIPDLTIKMNAISDTGTAFTTNLGGSNLYGNVPNTGNALCAANTAIWTFSQTTTTNFTFNAEADGTPPVVHCTKTVTTLVANEANPFATAVSVTYSMVGGGGGGDDYSSPSGGGGGGGSSAVLDGSSGTTLVSAATGGAGGGHMGAAGANGTTASGTFTLAAGDELSVFVGGGGGSGAAYAGGGGGSGFFGGGGGGGGGGNGGAGAGGSTVGGAGGTGTSAAAAAGSSHAGGMGGIFSGFGVCQGGTGGTGGANGTWGGGGGGFGGGGGGGNLYGGGATANGGSNGANGGNASGGAGANTFASNTTLPAGAGAGGVGSAAVSDSGGGAGGLVILSYNSPDGSCSL